MISIKNQIIIALLATDDESQLSCISSLIKGMGIFRNSKSIQDKQYMLLNSIFDYLGQDKMLNDTNTLNDILKCLDCEIEGLNDEYQVKTRDNFKNAIISLIDSLNLEKLQRIYNLTLYLWKN